MSNAETVLLFVDRMRVGGIQTLLVELMGEFASMGQPCELLLLDDGEHYDLEDEVRASGFTVHKLEGIWVRKPADFLRYQRAVRQFYQEHHDYCVVHVNSGSKNYPILKYAARWEIPVRIAHSHNTGFQTSSKVQQVMGDLLKLPLRRYATRCLACSDRAGEWLFGKRWMSEGKVTVLPNGIPLRDYAFSIEKRQGVRGEWEAGEGTLVVGHVGRFTTQKNHSFLLDIFDEVHRKMPNSILVLAGIGELQDATREKADALGLGDSVRFLGFRADVADLLQGMDVFLMPSLYEGFPVTGVEAQATGLPCVFSDTITREAQILDIVAYLSLDARPAQWANAVIQLAGSNERERAWRTLSSKGYDVQTMAERLIGIYHGWFPASLGSAA